MENETDSVFEETEFVKVQSSIFEDVDEDVEIVPSTTYHLAFDKDKMRLRKDQEIILELDYSELKNPSIRTSYKEVCGMISDVKSSSLEDWKSKYLKEAASGSERKV